MNTKVLAIAAILIIVGGGAILYINNSQDNMTTNSQVPYSPDLPNLANCTVDNYDSNNAWQITDTTGLDTLRTLTNTNKLTFSGKTIYLANDIICTGSFAAISQNPDYPFSGIFDGQGYKFSNANYSIFQATEYPRMAAMFGFAGNGAVFKNIDIDSCKISGNFYRASCFICYSDNYSKVGNTNVFEIMNCRLTGTITITPTFSSASESSYKTIGGFANDISGVELTNCGNIADITINASSSISSSRCYFSTIASSSKSMTGCYNEGTVTMNRTSNVTYHAIYGIGISNILRDCYNSGDLSGNVNIYSIAPNSKKINCYNTGSIISTDCKAYGIGDNAINCYNTGNVSGNVAYGIGENAIQSYNLGTVKSTGDNANGIGPNAFQCYNLGSISAESPLSNAVVYGIGISAISCYNAGILTSSGKIQGIGNNSEYCYNVGQIIGDPSTQEIFPTGSSKHCYYLNTVCSVETDGMMTLEEMASDSFVNLIGKEHFDNNRINFKVNGELYAFPVLAWQTYYANFVEFDSSGGSIVEAQYVTSGDVASEPTVPTKQNKIFWYWSKDGQEYDFDSVVSSDLKLTAEWYDKLMFISYPPNSGGI